MPEPAKYRYYLRPGYGSEELLIEFTAGTDLDSFDNDLLNAIASIHPKELYLQRNYLLYLWANDEFLYDMSCDLGEFTIHKSIWRMAFIIADGNQPCILKINELLLMDARFEKEEVDYDNYKLKEDTQP